MAASTTTTTTATSLFFCINYGTFEFGFLILVFLQNLIFEIPTTKDTDLEWNLQLIN